MVEDNRSINDGMGRIMKFKLSQISRLTIEPYVLGLSIASLRVIVELGSPAKHIRVHGSLHL